MSYFYSNLKEHITKDKALREAKLKYINNSTNPEPYFWAPFVAIGDMSAIDFPNNSPNGIWLVSAFFLVGLLRFLFLKYKS